MTLNGVMALFRVISANSGSFRAHCVSHVMMSSCWLVVQHIRPYLLNVSTYLHAKCIIRTTNGNPVSDVYVHWRQAVSPQVNKPLKSVTHGQCDARPTVTSPAVGHHRHLTGTNLYCLVTEARGCEQLA